MKTLANITRRARRRFRQKGSALLVSLMAMVGLSLLGLAFVALSETENAIAINEQNHTQTVAVAESGAKLVLQWFQNPAQMLARGLMPANAAGIKTSRTVEAYSGYYKPTGLLCDIPFGPKNADVLYGDENSADVWINRNNAATFLDTLNAALFPTTEAGRITDIRIYAPPIVGGTQVDDGTGKKFWIGGQPYGVATIRVTAEKRDPSGRVGAQAVVRLVLAPFPLPGPTGALQALGNIGSRGNFNVNWGSVESQNGVDLKKTYTALPWFDAYDRAHIERGYDSSTVWRSLTGYQGNATYPLGDVVRPTGGNGLHEYVAMNTGISGALEPAWTPGPGSTTPDGTILWKERPPTMYPIKAADATNYENHRWLYEVVGHVVDDPWFQVRTWKNVQGNASTSPHPFPYAASPPPVMWGDSHYFQYQTFDQRPNYKRVEIPKFNYDFWKAAAIAGRGQKGVHYLSYTGSGYTDGVTTQSMDSWLGSGNGFYFFDTMNSLNPQNGGPGVLDTGGGDPCGFKGFVYANLESIKSTGCGGATGLFPQPGETYRDIGYRLVVEASSGLQVRGEWATDAAGQSIYVGAFNAQWDYQDLDWSDTGSNSATSGTKNDFFDVFIAQKTVKKESDGTLLTDYFPVEFYPGCKPGNNSSCPSCNCSEPHEPYLNMRYDGGALGLAPGWVAPGTAGVAKKTTPSNLPSDPAVTCSASDVGSKAGQDNCTTNAFDLDGGLASISPGIQGVIYNEGSFDSTGNGEYFGSIVVGKDTDPKGTCNVWFDERLLKGGWPPPGVNFPRVMVTSEQIQ
ncbi:MAG: hypothetical protein QOE82_3393 [Thermoanaerobaculia bacterium]|nr:hypothetical protein [Thermoanaerobaculia bacterium]